MSAMSTLAPAQLDPDHRATAAPSGSASAVLVASRFVYPALRQTRYDVGNIAYFLLCILMALGLCLMWGYCGMLSFGQTAFFGIAGYGYGVIADQPRRQPTAAARRARARASLVAALLALRARLFHVLRPRPRRVRRHRHLSVTLVLETFLRQTAGPEWRIGAAGSAASTA